MEFDTEKFIIEIQNRPAIWNTKLLKLIIITPEYSDKILKQRAWEQLVDIYHGTELSKEEKKKRGLSIQKKWRNIRDCFVKAHKANESKSGPAAKKNSYLFYDSLLFLKDTVTVNRTTGTVTTENEDDNTAMQNEETTSNTSWAPKRSKKNNSDDFIGTELVEALNKNLERRSVVDDEDRFFFLSLVKDLKNIPEYMQLQSKLDILKISNFLEVGRGNTYFISNGPVFRK